jgi:hypothetical protein
MICETGEHAMNGPALFLSYNSVDRPSVVAVQKLLAARGLMASFITDET